jgi:hypothetical protein
MRAVPQGTDHLNLLGYRARAVRMNKMFATPHPMTRSWVFSVCMRLTFQRRIQRLPPAPTVAPDGGFIFVIPHVARRFRLVDVNRIYAVGPNRPSSQATNAGTSSYGMEGGHRGYGKVMRRQAWHCARQNCNRRHSRRALHRYVRRPAAAWRSSSGGSKKWRCALSPHDAAGHHPVGSRRATGPPLPADKPRDCSGAAPRSRATIH